MNCVKFGIGVILMSVSMCHGELAKGTFDVKLQPVDSPVIGRMTLDKVFHGDLAGTSQGEMLAVRTAVKDSAGYVAMEKVTAKLAGRSGTFFLQHSGTMAGGKQELLVTVVPDSGTGELTGLSGKLAIIIEGGKHLYEFSYTLPATRSTP